MSACCNSCKQKQFTVFRAHVYLQTERWRSYTSTIPKTCYNSSKTADFPLQAFENSSLEVSEKSEIVATQDTQALEVGLTVNLVPRVLSYPPYGARERETRVSLSLRRTGRREPWERGCLTVR